MLAKFAGKAHILFFQNIWDDFDEIARHLLPEQYFFGFPFMAGGGRDENGIRCVISGLKYSNTPLGELSGETTPRLQKMAEAMEEANLKPFLSNQIKAWLITHYAIAAGLSAGIMKAGSGKAFAGNSALIKETIQSIRKGLSICSKRGINPKIIKSNQLYYLPLCISVPLARKIYSHESLCMMFDGHIGHSPGEIKKMIEDFSLH